MSTYLGEGFDWSSLWGAVGTTATAAGGAFTSSQQTEQAKILARANQSSGGSGSTIPTSAWDTMSKPLMIGGAALAGVVLIMALTKR